MDLIAKFLFLSGKFITYATGRTILAIIHQSVKIHRHLACKYEELTQVVKPYDNMVELLNARTDDSTIQNLGLPPVNVYSQVACQTTQYEDDATRTLHLEAYIPEESREKDEQCVRMFRVYKDFNGTPMDLRGIVEEEDVRFEIETVQPDVQLYADLCSVDSEDTIADVVSLPLEEKVGIIEPAPILKRDHNNTVASLKKQEYTKQCFYGNFLKDCGEGFLNAGLMSSCSKYAHINHLLSQPPNHSYFKQYSINEHTETLKEEGAEIVATVDTSDGNMEGQINEKTSWQTFTETINSQCGPTENLRNPTEDLEEQQTSTYSKIDQSWETFTSNLNSNYRRLATFEAELNTDEPQELMRDISWHSFNRTVEKSCAPDQVASIPEEPVSDISWEAFNTRINMGFNSSEVIEVYNKLLEEDSMYDLGDQAIADKIDAPKLESKVSWHASDINVRKNLHRTTFRKLSDSCLSKSDGTLSCIHMLMQQVEEESDLINVNQIAFNKLEKRVTQILIQQNLADKDQVSSKGNFFEIHENASAKIRNALMHRSKERLARALNNIEKERYMNQQKSANNEMYPTKHREELFSKLKHLQVLTKEINSICSMDGTEKFPIKQERKAKKVLMVKPEQPKKMTKLNKKWGPATTSKSMQTDRMNLDVRERLRMMEANLKAFKIFEDYIKNIASLNKTQIQTQREYLKEKIRKSVKKSKVVDSSAKKDKIKRVLPKPINIQFKRVADDDEIEEKLKAGDTTKKDKFILPGLKQIKKDRGDRKEKQHAPVKLESKSGRGGKKKDKTDKDPGKEDKPDKIKPKKPGYPKEYSGISGRYNFVGGKPEGEREGSENRGVVRSKDGSEKPKDVKTEENHAMRERAKSEDNQHKFKDSDKKDNASSRSANEDLYEMQQRYRYSYSRRTKDVIDEKATKTDENEHKREAKKPTDEENRKASDIIIKYAIPYNIPYKHKYEKVADQIKTDKLDRKKHPVESDIPKKRDKPVVFARDNNESKDNEPKNITAPKDSTDPKKSSIKDVGKPVKMKDAQKPSEVGSRYDFKTTGDDAGEPKDPPDSKLKEERLKAIRKQLVEEAERRTIAAKEKRRAREAAEANKALQDENLPAERKYRADRYSEDQSKDDQRIDQQRIEAEYKYRDDDARDRSRSPPVDVKIRISSGAVAPRDVGDQASTREASNVSPAEARALRYLEKKAADAMEVEEERIPEKPKMEAAKDAPDDLKPKKVHPQDVIHETKRKEMDTAPPKPLEEPPTRPKPQHIQEEPLKLKHRTPAPPVDEINKSDRALPKVQEGEILKQPVDFDERDAEPKEVSRVDKVDTRLASVPRRGEERGHPQKVPDYQIKEEKAVELMKSREREAAKRLVRIDIEFEEPPLENKDFGSAQESSVENVARKVDQEAQKEPTKADDPPRGAKVPRQKTPEDILAEIAEYEQKMKSSAEKPKKDPKVVVYEETYASLKRKKEAIEEATRRADHQKNQYKDQHASPIKPKEAMEEASRRADHQKNQYKDQHASPIKPKEPMEEATRRADYQKNQEHPSSIKEKESMEEASRRADHQKNQYKDQHASPIKPKEPMEEATRRADYQKYQEHPSSIKEKESMEEASRRADHQKNQYTDQHASPIKPKESMEEASERADHQIKQYKDQHASPIKPKEPMEEASGRADHQIKQYNDQHASPIKPKEPMEEASGRADHQIKQYKDPHASPIKPKESMEEASRRADHQIKQYKDPHASPIKPKEAMEEASRRADYQKNQEHPSSINAKESMEEASRRVDHQKNQHKEQHRSPIKPEESKDDDVEAVKDQRRPRLIPVRTKEMPGPEKRSHSIPEREKPKRQAQAQRIREPVQGKPTRSSQSIHDSDAVKNKQMYYDDLRYMEEREKRLRGQKAVAQQDESRYAGKRDKYRKQAAELEKGATSKVVYNKAKKDQKYVRKTSPPEEFKRDARGPEYASRKYVAERGKGAYKSRSPRPQHEEKKGKPEERYEKVPEYASKKYASYHRRPSQERAAQKEKPLDETSKKSSEYNIGKPRSVDREPAREVQPEEKIKRVVKRPDSGQPVGARTPDQHHPGVPKTYAGHPTKIEDADHHHPGMPKTYAAHPIQIEDAKGTPDHHPGKKETPQTYAAHPTKAEDAKDPPDHHPGKKETPQTYAAHPPKAEDAKDPPDHHLGKKDTLENAKDTPDHHLGKTHAAPPTKSEDEPEQIKTAKPEMAGDSSTPLGRAPEAPADEAVSSKYATRRKRENKRTFVDKDTGIVTKEEHIEITETYVEKGGQPGESKTPEAGKSKQSMDDAGTPPKLTFNERRKAYLNKLRGKTQEVKGAKQDTPDKDKVTIHEDIVEAIQEENAMATGDPKTANIQEMDTYQPTSAYNKMHLEQLKTPSTIPQQKKGKSEVKQLAIDDDSIEANKEQQMTAAIEEKILRSTQEETDEKITEYVKSEQKIKPMIDEHTHGRTTLEKITAKSGAGDDKKISVDEDSVEDNKELNIQASPELQMEDQKKSATKSAMKPEMKPDMKPEIKPEMKREMKPEIKPEIKPEMRPEIETKTTSVGAIAEKLRKRDFPPESERKLPPDAIVMTNLDAVQPKVVKEDPLSTGGGDKATLEGEEVKLEEKEPEKPQPPKRYIVTDSIAKSNLMITDVKPMPIDEDSVEVNKEDHSIYETVYQNTVDSAKKNSQLLSAKDIVKQRREEEEKMAAAGAERSAEEQVAKEQSVNVKEASKIEATSKSLEKQVVADEGKSAEERKIDSTDKDDLVLTKASTDKTPAESSKVAQLIDEKVSSHEQPQEIVEPSTDQIKINPNRLKWDSAVADALKKARQAKASEPKRMPVLDPKSQVEGKKVEGGDKLAKGEEVVEDARKTPDVTVTSGKEQDASGEATTDKKIEEPGEENRPQPSPPTVDAKLIRVIPRLQIPKKAAPIKPKVNVEVKVTYTRKVERKMRESIAKAVPRVKPEDVPKEPEKVQTQEEPPKVALKPEAKPKLKKRRPMKLYKPFIPGVNVDVKGSTDKSAEPGKKKTSDDKTDNEEETK